MGDNAIHFYLLDFIFRKILRKNANVPYPIHFTSTIHNPEKLTLGENTFPGDSPGVYINARNGITIGDNTNIGPNVVLVSANHDFFDNSSHTKNEPIIIGKNCWFGGNSCVLPGIILGDNTIVGAGAVVTKSFEEGYCVIAGNPAKIIKKLEQNL